MSGDGEAGVPENEAFDGDATTSATPSGVAPGGNDAMPDDDGQPPIDGGVMGAVPPTGTVAPTGVTVNGDRDGELPPEESGR
jgi:hypothetical protein